MDGWFICLLLPLPLDLKASPSCCCCSALIMLQFDLTDDTADETCLTLDCFDALLASTTEGILERQLESHQMDFHNLFFPFLFHMHRRHF